MKDVVGYEGLYKVSEDGTVYNNKGKIVKSRISNRGYHRVNLSRYGEIKTHRLHRIVAMAYLDTDDISLEVDHIDGNKDNNHMNNLRWCTGKENIGFYYENNPDRRAIPTERKYTDEELENLYEEKGIGIVVNGVQYRSVSQAAKMIANAENKNLQTIRKELRNYVQGKRPEWCMYGKYTIGY